MLSSRTNTIDHLREDNIRGVDPTTSGEFGSIEIGLGIGICTLIILGIWAWWCYRQEQLDAVDGTEKRKVSMDFRESLTKTTSTLADMASSSVDMSFSEKDTAYNGVQVYPAQLATALPDWNSRSSNILLPHNSQCVSLSKEPSKSLEEGSFPDLSLSMVSHDSVYLVEPSPLSASIASHPTSISV